MLSDLQKEIKKHVDKTKKALDEQTKLEFMWLKQIIKETIEKYENKSQGKIK